MFNFKDTDIDIESSIQSERIVYHSRWFHFFLDKGLFLLIFLIILVSFFMVMFIKEPAVATNNAWGFYLPLLIITGLISISGFNTDKLKRIRGNHKEANRKLINEILKELEWNIDLHNQGLTIATPSAEYLFNGGRQVTIIYDRNDILINSTAYSFFAGVSPLHFVSNGSLVRQLQRKFEQKLGNNFAQ